MQKNTSHKLTSEKSIDLIEILKIIWVNRKPIVKSSSLFLLFGIILATLSPVIYISETSFIPQVSEKSISDNSGLGTLASIAGININQVGQSNDLYISPYLYPKIVESEEFLIKIINEELVLEDGKRNTLKEYLKSENNGLSVSSIFTEKSLQNDKKSEFLEKYNFISQDEYSAMSLIKQKFSIELNERVGFIKVSGMDKNPLISTQIAELVTKNLQSMIISLRTNKIKDQVNYTKKEYLKQKEVFEKIQNDLAKFTDSNKNISTALFLAEKQKLESEYQLQQNLLINLATEYSNNKIKLNKDTPIFSVIDEVTVPNSKSQPKRILMILLSLFVGLFISISYVFLKTPFRKVINYIKVK